MTSSPIPRAAWRVTLDGKDMTGRMAPRLLSLSLNEKRGNEADQLDIVLDNVDGKLAMPPTGVTLKVALGWERGPAGLPIGLIDKGDFIVDERSAAGPPDTIRIRARSADLRGNFRVRRERAFVGQSVGYVVKLLAAENGLTERIDPDLAGETIEALGHGAKSDAALLQDLGRRFDAVATVKGGYLIFSAIGKGETATGLKIPALSIARRDCGGFRFEEADRGQYGGVVAKWHNIATGQQEKVVAGSEHPAPKRLRKVYASESSALQAATAELKRMKRGKARISFPLSLGRPDIYPDRAITLTGYMPEINALSWLVAETTHNMDGKGGLDTRLQLETAL